MNLQFDFTPTKFDGVCYDHSLDHKRLSTQYNKVFNLMKDSTWRSLREIAEEVKAPEASVSAILRDFRKQRNGGHTVNRMRSGNPENGLFKYQLITQ